MTRPSLGKHRAAPSNRHARQCRMLLAAAPLVGGVLILSGCSTGPAEPPPVSPSPSITAAPSASSSPQTTPGEVTKRWTPGAPITSLPDSQAPEDAAGVLIDELASLTPGTEEGDQALLQVATGTLLEDLQATAQEYADSGWRINGSPTVDRIEMMERNLDGTPPTFTVRACVDSSSVDVVDEQGISVLDPDRPTRSWVWYTVTSDANSWLLSAQSFGDEVDC